MGAYIEMLPPDRPVNMIGQPIIKLVADGGPGGDLGDMGYRRWRRGYRGAPWGPPPWAYAPPTPQVVYQQPFMAPAAIDAAFDGSGSMPTAADVSHGMGQRYSTALQREITTVTAGDAPDVSAEYFRPKNIPGLPSEYEGPHTGRQGIYPQKLRDQVEFDMSGNSAFISLSDIASARPMPNFGGSLGCCGADGMSGYGVPGSNDVDVMGNYGMPLSDDAAPEAKLLKGRCEGLEAKAKEIVAAVAKAGGDSSLSVAQKNMVVKTARQSLRALRGEWRLCRKRLKQIIKHFKKQGNLKELGLSGLADKVENEETVARCKAQLRAIHQKRNEQRSEIRGMRRDYRSACK